MGATRYSLNEKEAHFAAWALSEYAGWLAMFPYTHTAARDIAKKLDPELVEWEQHGDQRPSHEDRASMIADQIVKLCVGAAGDAGPDGADVAAFLDRVAAVLRAEAETARNGRTDEPRG